MVEFSVKHQTSQSSNDLRVYRANIEYGSGESDRIKVQTNNLKQTVIIPVELIRDEIPVTHVVVFELRIITQPRYRTGSVQNIVISDFVLLK